jgi:SAM-dependent methyltransferase
MTREELIEKIESYRDPKTGKRRWYQRIELAPGLFTPGRMDSGEAIWSQIRNLMPQSIAGMSVLDLGSNAGFFCVKSALDGAEPVYGVERSQIFLSQAHFIRRHFDEKANMFLPVYYVDYDMDFSKDEPMPIKGMSSFDISLCIAAFYQIKGPNERIAEWLGRRTNHTIIVRCVRNHERGKDTVLTNVLTDMGWRLTHKDKGNVRRYLVRYEK